MAENSAIEWTDATWNPTTGCSRVSGGCDHCYAMHFARRFDGQGKGYDGTTRRGKRGTDWTGVVNLHPDRLPLPFRWRKPRRVFVDSMSDLFHPAVPFDFIGRVFGTMALAPRHTFQVLTKRPERAEEILAVLNPQAVWDAGRTLAALHGAHPRDKPREVWPLPNVWLGTSVEDQAAADERIPALLRCPAAVRFLSCEPLLGPVRLDQIQLGDPRDGVTHNALTGIPYDWDYEQAFSEDRIDGIHWVIVGGESGSGARDCALSDVRAVVEQCQAAGVPVFVKQLGARPVWGDSVADMHYAMRGDRDPKGGDISQFPEDLRVREFPPAVEEVLE